ncbi:MAG: N-6 DNA methylase [Gemmatimonadetes bacterium]|nr:N-6 DNA methylase [Gemmatimonadota bacterium]
MDLLAAVDLSTAAGMRRHAAAVRLHPVRRKRLGQFFTPAPIARFMASLVATRASRVRILDPGAGVGSLLAAVIEELCSRSIPPRSICATAIEVDWSLHDALQATMADCQRLCTLRGVEFEGEVLERDFIAHGVSALETQLGFESASSEKYDIVIMNPPYRKIGSRSPDRRRLESLGIETPNLYSAFLAIGAMLLRDGGELIAITPRSFCNGSYFRAFRHWFLGLMSFSRLHVIESRNEAFAEDGVLQENVIFRAHRGAAPPTVLVTSGSGSPERLRYRREIPVDELVLRDDPDMFIHLPVEPDASDVARIIRQLPCELADLGLTVSTGRVVDFRARDALRAAGDPGTVPLIYPTHFSDGSIVWPKGTRKPEAIVKNSRTLELLVPAGHYVLVRRFSAKEEPRRVVAAIYDPARVRSGSPVGFENHLNYFHRDGNGIDPLLARGLASFLNSTWVDRYFRQFSGHTQVNAGDLRKLRYPRPETLRSIGERARKPSLGQAEIDAIVEWALDASLDRRPESACGGWSEA